MKKLMFIFFTSLCLPLLTGCYDKVNREDLIGVYYSNHGHGEEKLELRADGSYILTYTDNGEIVLKNTNSWELESSGSALSFKGFVFGYRDMPPAWGNTPGWWHVEIEQSWQGKIELNTDPDLGYYYIKD